MSQNAQSETKKIVRTLVMFAPVCAMATYSGTAWADRVDTIRILLHEGKTEAAENRCERWSAASSKNHIELREVCAQVFWRRVEQSDRFDDWVAYRNTWSGTSWAELALKREAGARLASLEPSLSESDLLALGDLYGTTSMRLPFKRWQPMPRFGMCKMDPMRFELPRRGLSIPDCRGWLNTSSIS